MDSRAGAQACASCKYQRRRCNPDCPLAPFFPPHHQRQFANAHRVFGVSNILKILRNLEPAWRPDAIKTIVFQANMRSRDPVRGCTGLIEELKKHTNWTRAELEITLGHLHTIKQQVHVLGGAAGFLDLGIGRGLAFGTQHFQYSHFPLAQPMQPTAFGSVAAAAVGAHAGLPHLPGESVRFKPRGSMGFEGGSMWVHHAPMHVGESCNSRPIPPGSSTRYEIREDEFKPFIDILVDQETIVETKEKPECSTVNVVKYMDSEQAHQQDEHIDKKGKGIALS